MMVKAPKEDRMSESYRAGSSEQQWSSTGSAANGYQNAFGKPIPSQNQSEIGKALLVGVLGGLVSAAGYLIYRRLPDEQKEKINAQVRSIIAQRITEIRENFNI
jgi:hypothetical protein